MKPLYRYLIVGVCHLSMGLVAAFGQADALLIDIRMLRSAGVCDFYDELPIDQIGLTAKQQQVFAQKLDDGKTLIRRLVDDVTLLRDAGELSTEKERQEAFKYCKGAWQPYEESLKATFESYCKGKVREHVLKIQGRFGSTFMPYSPLAEDLRLTPFQQELVLRWRHDRYRKDRVDLLLSDMPREEYDRVSGGRRFEYWKDAMSLLGEPQLKRYCARIKGDSEAVDLVSFLRSEDGNIRDNWLHVPIMGSVWSFRDVPRNQWPDFVEATKLSRHGRLNHYRPKIVSSPYIQSDSYLDILRRRSEKLNGIKTEKPFGWIQPPLDEDQKARLSAATEELSERRRAASSSVIDKLLELMEVVADTPDNIVLLRNEYLRLYDEVEEEFASQYIKILSDEQQQFVAEMAMKKNGRFNLFWSRYRWLTEHFDISEANHERLKQASLEVDKRLKAYYLELRKTGRSVAKDEPSPEFEDMIYALQFRAMQGLSKDQVRRIWITTNALRDGESWHDFLQREEPSAKRNLAKHFSWFEAE